MKSDSPILTRARASTSVIKSAYARHSPFSKSTVISPVALIVQWTLTWKALSAKGPFETRRILVTPVNSPAPREFELDAKGCELWKT